MLGEHPIYTFKFEKTREGHAHHVKRNKDMSISIQTSCPALSIHEITHIRQSLELNNHLRFENGYLNGCFLLLINALSIAKIRSIRRCL